MKLFPVISTMYAHAYSSQYVYNTYLKLVEGVKTGDFELLDVMHHYTSGMKSVFTQETWDSLISIR